MASEVASLLLSQMTDLMAYYKTYRNLTGQAGFAGDRGKSGSGAEQFTGTRRFGAGIAAFLARGGWHGPCSPRQS